MTYTELMEQYGEDIAAFNEVTRPLKQLNRALAGLLDPAYTNQFDRELKSKLPKELAERIALNYGIFPMSMATKLDGLYLSIVPGDCNMLLLHEEFVPTYTPQDIKILLDTIAKTLVSFWPRVQTQIESTPSWAIIRSRVDQILNSDNR